MPPPEVMSYQLGLSKEPVLGESRINLRGWGWYPIRVEEKTAVRPAQVTFVQFLPRGDPAKNPITIFYRSEKFPDEFFAMEKHFAWGAAKIFKSGMLPNKEIHFAWIPGHQLFVTAPNEVELLAALSVLELSAK